MKILVTGGAGFIGSHLIRQWLRTDSKIQIVNLDKLTYCGDLSRLRDLESDKRYQFVRADICDAVSVEKTMRGCDGVVHLAAETHVDRSLLDGKAFFDTNLYGTSALLEYARKLRVKRFVYVSTDEVYGSRPTGAFTEKDGLNPSNPYSISKAAADKLALSYAAAYGLSVSVTRGSNTYGFFQYPEKVIPLFVARALSGEFLPLYGDGRQVRSWLHAEDHAAGIRLVFEKGKPGEAYNIAGGTHLKNIDLTKKILKILNKPESLIRRVKDRAAHDRRYSIDARKIKKLGWREEKPFDAGLRDVVLWYAQNTVWWKRIKEKSADFREYYAKAYAERDS